MSRMPRFAIFTLVAVIAGTSQVVISVPATAAVPLIPASEPTAPPPK